MSKEQIRDNDTENLEGGAKEQAVETGRYQGFDRGILEDFGKDAEQMEKANKLDSATKKDCLSLISEQSAEARASFKEKFFEDHKSEITKGGDYLENGGSIYIERMFKKYGGEKALMSGEYPEAYQELTRLKLLQEGFNKDNIAPEFKLLMVNKLYAEMEKNKEGIEELNKVGNKKKEGELKLRNEKLFSLSQNLSSNILGRDIKKETEAENPYPNEEDKKIKLKELVDSEYDKEIMKTDDDGSQILIENILAEYGYSFKDKGLIRRETVAYDKDGKVLKSFKHGFTSGKIKNGEDYGEWMTNSLKKEIEKKNKDEFEKDWKKDKDNITNDIRNSIEEKIGKIAKSPEQAVVGVEGYYDKVMESVLKEEREKAKRIDASKRKKVENKDKETAVIPSKLLKSSQKLNLTGEFEKDINTLKDFIKDEGLEMVDRDVLNNDKDLDEYVKDYGWYHAQKDKKYSGNIWEAFLLGLFNAMIKELAPNKK